MEQASIRQHFGKQVQYLRRFNKLTQEQLAEKTELSVDTISNVERGLSSSRLETIDSLAKALSVSPVELFQFEGPAEHHSSSRKDVQRLVKLISQCPKDRLPKLIAIVEQAIDMAKD
jgi:transcriptional regulator with XRE-family HTH domain